MTDTPMYETEAIQHFVDARKKSAIGSTKYNRMINEAYWAGVKEELGDDFSILKDSNKAREFGYNLAKEAILKAGLASMGLSEDTQNEIETKQAERAFRMLTGGRFGMKDYAEQVVNAGEDFERQSMQLHSQLAGIYGQQDEEAIAYEHLKDVSGEDLYAAIGSPDLKEGLSVEKLNFLKPGVKAELIDRFEKDGIVAPNELERIVNTAFN